MAVTKLESPHIRIPGYRVIREVGRGGIATVYLAIQESLDREVALKIMSPALAAEPNFTERFIREGRTVAQLTHPGIVTIYDISVADYQHYIAMEYLSGGSLKAAMQKGIAPAAALNIIRQVAAALGYAHEKGFVHRDVKPENILFRSDGAPVLTDFGIAKSTASSTQLTSTSVIVGTPRYMSPEQADGRGTDPRSDIYALGIVLYEMLTGKPPYQGRESIAILFSHINDPIPTLAPEHAHLQPLINAMLAKDPAQRVADCDTLGDMIRLVQHEERQARKLKKRQVRSEAGSARGPRRRAGHMTKVAGTPGRLPVVIWSGIALGITVATAAVLHALNSTPPPEPLPQQIAVPPPAQDAAVVTPLPEPVATDGDRSSQLQGPQPNTQRDVEPEPMVAAEPEGDASETLEPVTPQPAAAEPDATVGPVESVESKAGRSPGEERRAESGAGAATPKDSVVATASRRSREPEWRAAARKQQVDTLLKLAQKQIEQERLTHPPGDNAAESLHAVLKLDPDNADATAGLEGMVSRYLEIARSKVKEGSLESALAHVERGLIAVPDHVGLVGMKAQVQNMIEAERELAEAEKYFRGRGVPQDRAMAVEWYRKAATRGNSEAQFKLGVAYANGDGIPRSEEEALRWLRRAAGQGSKEAQYNLSLGLVFGPHPDPGSAAHWMKQLADDDYVPAYRVLGWMYTTGTGVGRSIRESIRWAAKGVISNPIGDPPLPSRVINSWQRRFESALKESVKGRDEPS